MSGPAYMHASIATPGLAANHHTGNGQDHLRIVERPDAHIIFPSQEYAKCILSRNILSPADRVRFFEIGISILSTNLYYDTKVCAFVCTSV